MSRDPGDEWEDALAEAEQYVDDEEWSEVGEESMSFYERRLRLIEEAANKLRRKN